MNDNKPVNQGSQKLKYKRKREGEVYTGSKQLRSEGFSWWTSLLLGTDCTVHRDSTLPRLSTAERNLSSLKIACVQKETRIKTSNFPFEKGDWSEIIII